MDRREVLQAAIALPFLRFREAVAADLSVLRRAVPKSERKLPVVGLGTNNYSPTSPAELAARREVIAALAGVGGALIDTAPAYRESEAVLGELMADLGVRDRFFLATKVTAEGADPAAGDAMFEASLRRLRTGRVDLLQVHNLMGAETLLPRMAAWRSEGRIGAMGITTSTNRQYPAMLALMRSQALDFVQVDYSIANRAAAEQILPLAAERGIAVLVNLPFGGRRGGSVFRQIAERPLPEWAGEIGAATWGQFCLKYVLGHPAVSCAIPGTTQRANLEDNLAAGTAPMPDPAMRARMEAHWDTRITAA